ncbi:regulator of microtubule dynamics protein 1-like [Penaeus indicus]|uniref:regulator of microtubule dynamics protein 1-like n=1 Tax=Penaeus indicus TaxID=29960 RepID=UPI00300C8327
MFLRFGIRKCLSPVIRKTTPRTRAKSASFPRLLTGPVVKVAKTSIPNAVVFGVLGSGFYVGSVFAKENTLETLLAEADELYDAMKYEDIYVLLSAHKEVKHDEILWRLGRATYEKAKAAKTDDEKKVLYREALDYVEEALAINSENFAVHKWMSILIDYVYGYEGTKARISQSYNVKNHMEKACQLNPTDGTSRYLLGYWYYSIASIPWYQRKIASVVFATPPSGTYEDALEQFLHAEKLEPNFYSKNLLMIGKCYQILGKKEEAKQYLTRAMNYPGKTLDDKEAVDEATQLLKGL